MNVVDLEKCLAEARELGRQAGLAAAGWVVDGNTSQDHVVRMVAWQEDGDSRFFDYLPARPDLSGEWADAPTPLSLARDIIGDAVDILEPEIVDPIADAWEEGVGEVFEVECERLLREAIA